MDCKERIAAIDAVVNDPNNTATGALERIKQILAQPGECCVKEFARRQLAPVPGLPEASYFL